MFTNRSYRPIYADQLPPDRGGGRGGDVEAVVEPSRQRAVCGTNIEMTELNRQRSQTSTPSYSSQRVMAAERRWMQTRNWDRLFQRIYRYYTGRGMLCIVLSRVFNLLTVAFVAVFATFLIGCIDHKTISSKQTLAEALIPQCISQLSGFHRLMLMLGAGYWLWDLVDLLVGLRALMDMRELYSVLLGIGDQQLQQYVEWSSVVERIVAVHNRLTLLPIVRSATSSAPRRLNAHDLVNRIMRKENYFVALFNKDLLDLSLGFGWMPGMGHCGQVMLTKVLEWTMFYCIGDYVFGEESSAAAGPELAVKQQFLRDDSQRAELVEGLKRRFVLVGVLSFLLSPFIFVFLLFYFFFKYGKEIHSNPAALSSRTYTPLARWKFREFNELSHSFQNRLNSSYPAATIYMNQFPQERLAIPARFVAFVSGSLAVSLTILSILDDNILLNFQITPGRSVLWWLGLFGIIWSGARSLIPDNHSVHRPEQCIREVIAFTHYFPQDWHRFGLASALVHQEFGNYFEYRIVHFIHEMISVILAPFILCFSLPKSSGRILDFFREFTVHVDGVGWVCSFAVFDFRKFNRTSGPDTSPGDATASKMEQSIVDFKRNFPLWEPPNLDSDSELRDILERARELQQHEETTDTASSVKNTNNPVDGTAINGDTSVATRSRSPQADRQDRDL